MFGFKSTNKIKLPDGTPVFCLKKSEAIVLDDHIKGYFNHGIQLKDGDIVFDVGANIGIFGLRASQWYKNVEIHCFEPIPEIHEVLAKNARLSKNDKFHAYAMGLGSKSETISFTYFPNSPALSTSHPEMWELEPDAFKKAVKGSISNSPKSFWWSKLIPDFTIPAIAWYLQKGKRKINCQVSTLSNFIEEKSIKEINLLKMDCEGHEWEVLKGLSDAHWPKIKSIVMEIHDKDGRESKIRSILEKKGFKKITSEKEKSLENTDLINLFAIR
jgi:FkbM family methyltransferase